MPQSKKSMSKKSISKKSTAKKPSSKIVRKDSLTDEELGFATGGIAPRTAPRTSGRT